MIKSLTSILTTIWATGKSDIKFVDSFKIKQNFLLTLIALFLSLYAAGFYYLYLNFYLTVPSTTPYYSVWEFVDWKLAIVLAFFALLLITAIWQWRWRSLQLFLISLLLYGFTLSLYLGLYPYNKLADSVARGTNSVLTIANAIPDYSGATRDFLEEYEEKILLAKTYPVQGQPLDLSVQTPSTHPPGSIIFLKWIYDYGQNHSMGMEATNLLAALAMVVLASLATPAVFLAAYKLSQSVITGLIASAVSLSAIQFYSYPSFFDGISAALIAWLFYLLLTQRPTAYFFGSIIISTLLAISYGNFIPILMVFGLTWLAIRPIKNLTTKVLALFIPFAFFLIGSQLLGFDYFQGFYLGVANHQHDYNQNNKYFYSLWWNYAELLAAWGPILFGLLVLNLTIFSRARRQSRDLLLPLIFMMIIIGVLGLSRAEVSRIWIFLLPLTSVVLALPLTHLVKNNRLSFLILFSIFVSSLYLLEMVFSNFVFYTFLRY